MFYGAWLGIALGLAVRPPWLPLTCLLLALGPTANTLLRDLGQGVTTND